MDECLAGCVIDSAGRPTLLFWAGAGEPTVFTEKGKGEKKTFSKAGKEKKKKPRDVFQ